MENNTVIIEAPSMSNNLYSLQTDTIITSLNRSFKYKWLLNLKADPWGKITFIL